MKASEVIAVLREIVQEHGDVEVGVADNWGVCLPVVQISMGENGHAEISADHLEPLNPAH